MKCKEAAVRGIETPVQEIRRKIFAAISKVAFESTNDTFNGEIEAIPYIMVANVSGLPWVCH